MGHVGHEVLDHDLGLLGQVVLVQGDEAGDGPPGLGRLVGGVLADGLLQLEEGLVGGVGGQHVVDEPLLDGLAHRVKVERLVATGVRVVATEQLQGLGLGRGREGEEAHVLLAPPGRHRLGQRLLHVVRRQLGGVVVGARLGCPEHSAQFLGGVAGLGGVGLVDDHGVAPGGQRLDVVEHPRELLQRGDDHPGLLAGQRRRQLGRRLVDALHHAVGVLELVDRVLQLAVEHHPVGDDHHLVEHLDVAGVQGRQAMRQPGDGVRLPRPGRVLDEVGVAGSLGSGRRLHAQHGVPLVVAGEDHARRLLGALGRLVHVHEAPQYVQPGVALPHLLPQVGGGMSGRVGRVAGPPLVAPVERQEECAGAGQPGGHGHPLRVDGEVDHSGGQGPVPRVAVAAVLGDGVVDAPAGEWVLQLGRGHLHAVDEQGQVDRPP